MKFFGLCLRCWNTGERYVYHGPIWGGWPQQCECQTGADNECCAEPVALSQAKPAAAIAKEANNG